MNITISGKDFHPTEADQTYVTEKLQKLERFHPNIQRIGVELDVDHNVTHGQKFRIEVWVSLPDKDIKAGLKAEHFQEAVDLVYPKLERQLVRSKEKMTGRWKFWKRRES